MTASGSKGKIFLETSLLNYSSFSIFGEILALIGRRSKQLIHLLLLALALNKSLPYIYSLAKNSSLFQSYHVFL